MGMKLVNTCLSVFFLKSVYCSKLTKTELLQETEAKSFLKANSKQTKSGCDWKDCKTRNQNLSCSREEFIECVKAECTDHTCDCEEQNEFVWYGNKGDYTKEDAWETVWSYGKADRSCD